MEIGRVDQIEAAIEDAIFDGRYADGDRLDEARLAAAFGVSRTPVREVLRRMAASGLVRQVPNRGVFVRYPGPVELFEMFQVMSELEALAARLASARILPPALAELRAANAACAEAARIDDPEAYYRANELFHARLYEESGNGFLAAECRALQKRLRPFRRAQLRLRGRMTQSLAEHERVITALEAADAEAAASTLRSHVAVQGEKFQHLLSVWDKVAGKQARAPL